jgi:hypothetical protein
VLAESTTLHGVFLDVLEMGVLITGASAIGKKSENRFHRAATASSLTTSSRAAPHFARYD